MQRGLPLVPRQRGERPKTPTKINLRSKFAPGLLFAAVYNEDGGQPLDLVEPHATGTLHGTAKYVTGPIVPGISVIGDSNYVDFGNPAKLAFTETSDFTIVSVVFHNTTGESFPQIFSNDSGSGSRILLQWRLDADVPEFIIGDSSATLGVLTGATAMAIRSYHVLAVTRVHGSALTIYMDGKQNATGADASSGTWTIGSGLWSTILTGTGSNGYTGHKHLDLVFNRALTAAEIAELTSDLYSLFEDETPPLVDLIRGTNTLTLNLPLPLETYVEIELSLVLPLPLESDGTRLRMFAIPLPLESTGSVLSALALLLESRGNVTMSMPLLLESDGEDPAVLSVVFQIFDSALTPLLVQFDINGVPYVLDPLEIRFDLIDTNPDVLEVTFDVIPDTLRTARLTNDVQAPIAKVTFA
jgi:hypothetical protein